jgi:hypothetical protein
MTDNKPDDLFLAATADSPEVNFQFSADRLSLKGESYPENAAAFYADVLARTRTYLESAPGKTTVDVALIYFNSSSTKILFSLCNMLNSAASKGCEVVLNWYHDPEDDTILEFGQELHDDFPLIDFHDRALSV